MAGAITGPISQMRYKEEKKLTHDLTANQRQSQECMHAVAEDH